MVWMTFRLSLLDHKEQQGTRESVHFEIILCNYSTVHKLQTPQIKYSINVVWQHQWRMRLSWKHTKRWENTNNWWKGKRGGKTKRASPQGLVELIACWADDLAG